uniref:Uncharacterized protein n=1 Tax=Anopheles farauti TaxID=69004 RepID=A0A182PZZ6_9DIPT
MAPFERKAMGKIDQSTCPRFFVGTSSPMLDLRWLASSSGPFDLNTDWTCRLNLTSSRGAFLPPAVLDSQAKVSRSGCAWGSNFRFFRESLALEQRIPFRILQPTAGNRFARLTLDGDDPDPVGPSDRGCRGRLAIA